MKHQLYCNLQANQLTRTVGEQNVQQLSRSKKKTFLKHLLDDIKALEIMVNENLIETGIHRIGAEQEFCLVDRGFRPSMKGPELLPKMNDDHFTSELARWNLEINLDPFLMKSGCLNNLESHLLEKLAIAEKVAEKEGNHVILTGILPTIRLSELDFDHMSPDPRYKVLSDMLSEMRGEDFNLYIRGVHEMSLKHSSILFEACNTSFQAHLQLDAKSFADYYNWAQMISAPVLASCTNSPILLGKELWKETRIALFRQSIDVRHAGNFIRDKQPRVSFGYDWIENSVAEIYKNDISRYPLLITADIGESSLDVLKRGELPELKALNLHNGTLYKWNRACYGLHKGVAHLRIENRYIPSGPSPIDEIASTAFWAGLMLALPEEYKGNWSEMMAFKDVRGNFVRAARSGLANDFQWFGENVNAVDLLLDRLIPMSREGLKNNGVSQEEIDKYIGVVENRVKSRQTGSKWVVNCLRKLKKTNTRDESLLIITQAMYKNAKENKPGHTWDCACNETLKSIVKKYERVDSIMTTDLYTVSEDDLVILAENIMNWNNIRHIPVENADGGIIGIVSHTTINDFRANHPKEKDKTVGEIMVKEIKTISPDARFENANTLMKISGIGCLPVVQDSKLVGLITDTDVREVMQKTKVQ